MILRRAVRLAGFSVVLAAASACNAAGQPQQQQQSSQAPNQARPDLYACDGCEAVHERNPETLSWRTTMAPEGEPGEPLILRGTVYQQDGTTPAPGVVVYAYQTNAEGAYAGGTNESESSRRHGRIRGWVKTGADGRYEFATIKPAPYPTITEPAHIHLVVLEPGRRSYWIDDVVFAGEVRVDEEYRRSRTNQGGDGIVQLQRRDNGTWIAQRDIRLEPHPG